MKKSVFLSLMVLLFAPGFPISFDESDNSLPFVRAIAQTEGTWWDKVRGEIETSTYHIKEKENHKFFYSQNINHRMQTNYHPRGFEITPIGHSNDLVFGLNLEKIQVGNCLLSLQDSYKAKLLKQQLNIDFGTYTIEYINNKNGMRQNFIIKEGDERSSSILVELKIADGWKGVPKGNKHIQFISTSPTAKNHWKEIAYRDLKCWDAEGRQLESHMGVRDDQSLYINVNTQNAAYPITIDPLSTTADWTYIGPSIDAEFGYSLKAAGDVNADGYADVIVGAWLENNSFLDGGAAYVFYGSATGLSSVPDWKVEGNGTEFRLGTSVSGAGDVDGDGIDDIIVGARWHTNGESKEGAAFVWFGSPLGLDPFPTVATADWMAESNQVDANFGYSVASAGDVNGDGIDDIVIGTPYYDVASGGDNKGAAFIWYGNTNFSLTNGNPGNADVTLLGDKNDSEYASSVASAGDFNGDGFDEVIIGAPFYNATGPGSSEGSAFLYLGSNTGLSSTADWIGNGEFTIGGSGYGKSVAAAGDVNGDGFDDIMVGSYKHNSDHGKVYVYYGSCSNLSTIPGWTAESDLANAFFGHSVDSLGDVNCDGISDIIIGAYTYNNIGSAFIWLGSPTGLGPAGTPSNAFWSVSGTIPGNSRFAWRVAGVGDVNGDGLGDVALSDDAFDNPTHNVGKGFLYLSNHPNCCNPLPLQLQSFEAKWLSNKRNIELAWGIPLSSTLSFFSIETSYDLESWKVIGKVYAEDSPIYRFFDKNIAPQAFSPEVYYRLKLVDANNNFSYSQVISLPIGQTQLFISPNPIADHVNIFLPRKESRIQIDLKENEGSLIKSFTYNERKQIQLPIENTLPPGIYILTIQIAERVHSFKVLKQ